MSKCRVCRGPAIIDLPRHNANFCAEHLQQLCRRQVEKAIADHDMLPPDDRVLVAVSGGKDSLAVWDLLIELGYQRRRAVHRPRHRRLQRRQRRATPRRSPPSAGCALRTIDLRDDARLRRADGVAGDAPGAVLGVRAVEAAPVRRRRPRRRLRRRRHRPQPRRRGGRAARQHAALGRRVPRPPAAGAAGAATASRGRSSRWCASPSGRRRRGASCAASTTRSRSARWRPATSTSATRRRSTSSSATSPGTEGGVLPQLRRAHGAAARRALDAAAVERAAARARRCGAPTTGEVCAVLPARRDGVGRTSRCPSSLLDRRAGRRR